MVSSPPNAPRRAHHPKKLPIPSHCSLNPQPQTINWPEPVKLSSRVCFVHVNWDLKLHPVEPHIMKIQPYIVQIIQAFTQRHKPHKPNPPIEPPAVAALVGAPEARETAGVKLDQRFRPLRLRGSGFRVWGFRVQP